uniref:Sphingolipid transporter 3 (putative) n=2 Tax=Sarcophilus harrisii TaxID=9305 RepID=A0A7N4V5T9_SARHA
SVAAGHQPSPGSPGSPRTGTRALVWALLGGGCPPCLLFLLPGINGESHFTDRKAGFLGSHLLRSHRKPQRWLWGLLSSCGPQGAPNTCGGHVLSSPNRGSRAPPLSLIFGALTVGTGFVGVLLGAEIARRFKKLTPTAEPLVCAGSLLAAAPCLFLSVTLAQRTLLEAYTFLALGELLLSFNWAIVTDILLSVVAPSRRGTAGALQISVSHILGDAGSPYITGLVASALQEVHGDSFLGLFRSLQSSFFICAFVGALGGGCFLVTALHMERDRPWAPAAQEAQEPPA